MDEPRKDCPFCGCKGENLDHDQVYINHECCGFVEWNAWNERPIEDDLRARLAAAEARVEELEGKVVALCIENDQALRLVKALQSGNTEYSRRVAELEGLLLQCRDAFHFTREYVEPKVSLPAIPGWSWYDAVTAIDAALRGEEVQGE